MGSPLAWGCGHRATIPCFTAAVFVSLLSAISLKDKFLKKGYIWKATASKWLPGSYSLLCLFS